MQSISDAGRVRSRRVREEGRRIASNGSRDCRARDAVPFLLALRSQLPRLKRSKGYWKAVELLTIEAGNAGHILPCLSCLRHAHSSRDSRVVVEVALLLGLHRVDARHVVLVAELRGSPAERLHASLHADGLELGPVEVLRAPGQLGEVHVVLLVVHLPRVNHHDAGPGVLIRVRQFDLAVQPTGTQQSWVKRVGPVCGGDNLHRRGGREAV
mmetsp:Transcript_106734/g.333872  ORF Transcript_106734/g.333872 Transcript_106734/m.333872 type:complete len:212 (-) Transcript_106734:122-757(-)